MQWEQGQDSIPVWLWDRVLSTHARTLTRIRVFQSQYVVTPASQHSCAYFPGCMRNSGAFLFRVVCVQASHPCIRGLCLNLVHTCLRVFALPAHLPLSPISRAPARLPFALWLRGWEVTAAGPDSPIPTPRCTPSPRLVTSLSEPGPGPVSSSPICLPSSRVSSPCEVLV